MGYKQEVSGQIISTRSGVIADMEEGKRFSLLYLDKGAPIKDSERFRNRLSSYCSQYLSAYKEDISNLIELETGSNIPYMLNHGRSFSKFYGKCTIHDVLDSITIIYNFLISRALNKYCERWIFFVSRIFREENLGYRLDQKGGVHFYIDEDFERNRFSTLQMIENPRYIAVKSAYEDAYRHFDNDPVDTKAAVRSMFESIEVLAKQMVVTKNLNKFIVEKDLKYKCLQLYNGDETAKSVVSSMFDSFSLWVNGIHLYRHGQDDDKPVRPPVDLAVYVLSSGSSYLRWLIELNEKLITVEQ